MLWWTLLENMHLLTLIATMHWLTRLLTLLGTIYWMTLPGEPCTGDPQRNHALVNPPGNIAQVTALGRNPLGDPHMGTMHLGEPLGNHALIDLTLIGSLVDPTILGTIQETRPG